MIEGGLGDLTKVVLAMSSGTLTVLYSSFVPMKRTVLGNEFNRTWNS
jgi:hypothetical protein